MTIAGINKSSSEMLKNKKSAFPIFLIFLLATLLLTLFNERVPGPHSDEVWFVFTPGELVEVGRPSAISFYTGDMYYYALYFIYAIFGESIAVLRTFSAVMNILSLYIALRIAQYIPAGRNLRLLFALIICTSPFFITFTRYGNESSTFNPFLILLGIWLYIKSLHINKGYWGIIIALLSGLTFATVIKNHIISITAPISLIIAFSIFLPGKTLKERKFYYSIVAFLLAAALTYIPTMMNYSTNMRGIDINQLFQNNVLEKIYHTFLTLEKLWTGEYVYKRFVGFVDLPLLPYASIILIALLLMRLSGIRKAPITGYEKALALTFVLNTLFTSLIVFQLSLRYFLLSLWTIPFIIVTASASTAESNLKKSTYALLLTLAILNLFFFTNNYYLAFMKTGGVPYKFPVGKLFNETSSHFMSTENLYKQLAAKKIRRVFSETFIARPLLYHDREDRTIKFVWDITGSPPPSGSMDSESAIILYNYSHVEKRNQPPMTLHYENIDFKRDSSFDKRFLVYTIEGKVR